ncbi:MAG: glutamate racemase [Variibacter sp.]|nr:glutamate racemase [Variibacter sp.]
MIEHPTILFFDSGLGGLTVFREVAKARPDARFVYAADDALFPYGGVEEGRLTTRVLGLMADWLARYRPDLVVIACNTASTLVLPALRQHFSVPFVGTVPAIKPACAASATRHVAVLGTEATVKREYTHSLIREFAGGCRVTLVGSSRLAGFAEAELSGAPAPDEAVREEIAPCFVEEAHGRVDTIVLACTHYPLLLERFRALSPWPVGWVDPAAAIARRVTALVGPAKGPSATATDVVFTSGKAPSRLIAAALRGHGVRSPASEQASGG